MKAIVNERSTPLKAEKFPILYISRNAGVPFIALKRVDTDTLVGVWLAGYGANNRNCEDARYCNVNIIADKLEYFHGELVLSND